MYKIIGADQKQYGPITADQLRAWIGEGRANAQSKVQPVGSAEWVSLGEILEFADALGIPAPGASSPPPISESYLASEGPAKTSGLAITSLILGALGFCGITAVAGLILGIIAMVKINKSNGRLKGSGLAIAGVCLSGVMLLLSVMLSAMMLPALAKAKDKAQTINCVNNMKQLALAVRIYSGDNNDQFPPATTWCDAIHNEVGSERVFKCPVAVAKVGSNERSHYAFNSKLGGLNETNVSPETVMIFETTGGWNVNGGRELLVTPSRHGRKYIVALADGSVQQITEEQLNTLRWEP
jgi:hypothetical protein